VHPAAVGLDDHPLFVPDEVGPDHRLAVSQIDPSVDIRRRQTQLADDREERFLKLALGQRAADVVLVEHLFGATGRWTCAVARELVLKRF
jgi:hypothetical protein